MPDDNETKVTITTTDSQGIIRGDDMDTIPVIGKKYEGDELQRKARLYGRKWKITIFKTAYKKDENGNKVKDEEHSTAVDVSPFRCIFKTEQKLESAHTTLCTLAVYNLNAITEGEILTDGFQISIEGGYAEGQYGEIFTGDIVQVYRNRENGIDYRLEIVALRSSAPFDVQYTRTTIAAGSSPRQIIWAIVNGMQKPMGVGEISKDLEEGSLPRGKVLFGTPSKYLRDLCVGNGANFWQDENGKLTVKKVEDEIPANKCLVLTPITGLVGTPKYTDNGIQIDMLLDPRVKLYTLIKIDNEIIQRQPIKIDQNQDINKAGGNSQLPQQYQFDQTGEYQVASVSHQGDTWGDAWTTSVTGYSRNGRQGLLTATKTKGQSIR